MTTSVSLLAVAGYLLGAIPFGYLVARARGVDITKIGSGNIGATNVGRVLGRPYGLLVFALDFAKGALPTLLAPMFAQRLDAELAPTSAGVAAGVAAFLGHLFPVYLGFRGGKGVATGFGVVSVLLPGPTALAFAAWLLVVACSRYVSLASVSAAVVLVVARLAGGVPMWTGPQQVVTAFCLIAAGLIVLRHRANLARLVRGAENRMEEKPAMTLLVRVAHVMSVGLWFGAIVWFTFTGVSLFSTFERLSSAEPRPYWFPLPAELAGPSPGERFPDPLRKEQGSRVFGIAVGPMFTPYFALQTVCGVIALTTALSWWQLGRAQRARALVLAAALGLVGVSWWLDHEVEMRRIDRSKWSDAVLLSTEPRDVALDRAQRIRAEFGRWHGYSLLANFATLAMVTVAMGMTAALPVVARRAPNGSP